MLSELNQIGKSVDKFAKGRLKRVVGKVILNTPIATSLLASSDSINNPNIPALDIESSIPASVPLPENTTHNSNILQPYLPQFPTEIPPTSTPTPEPTSTPSAPKENKKLIPYSPSITIVDIAPSVPTENMLRQIFEDKNIPYISKERLIQEFGQNYEEKWDLVVEKYPQALIHKFTDIYLNHGKNVAVVAEDTLEKSGLKSTGINILPLQRIFDRTSVTLVEDSSGNVGISINFDQKRIIELLKGDPSRVINASFQVGNVELFQKTKIKTEVIPKYDPKDPLFSSEGLLSDDGKSLYQGAVSIRSNKDGNIDYLDAEGKKIEPISLDELEKRKLENSEVKEYKSTEFLIDGAYTKEKAMENLPKLFEICNKFPDQFLVAAGGNTGEDFREAMEALKNQIPQNLLITAEWVKGNYEDYNYEGPAMEVYGPEIYAYNEGSGSPHGSSFSVPELAAEIDVLLNRGLSFTQIKEKILASSDIHILELADGTDYTAKVFNSSKIQGNKFSS